MATTKKTTGDAGGKAKPVFTPTPQAKAQATTSRIIAGVLWAVAIGLEAFCIFWVLRPPFDDVLAAKGFPQWRWWLLIGIMVVIGAATIIGSQFWKKANHLDPASRKDTVRFFVQNQLGAIIALIAFVPLIILIFMNKDMDGKQKGIAGGIGILVAAVAVFAGIDFRPMSQEQKAVESQVVTQLTGKDEVWWATASGKVMHLCAGASDLKNSKNVQSGTTEQALSQTGMEGMTLKLEQELPQCNIAVPPAEQLAEIKAWVEQSRGR